MRDLKTRLWLFVLSGAMAAADLHGATCGSALLVEVAAPTVFDNVDASAPVVGRFWEAGAGGLNRSDQGCATGCTAAETTECVSGTNCLALTGINWLNASCGTAGHLPVRTIFVLEQASVDSGGWWAAINVDPNSTDANTDLDAKATAICGGCVSVISPLLGGTGYPSVGSPTIGGAHLTAEVSWTSPVAAAQALSNGPNNVVTSYAVYWKAHPGSPAPATGDRSGWVFAQDLQSDGVAHGGNSTDTSASVDVILPTGDHSVTFAIGLNFDGTGNPSADANVMPSTFISDQSDAVAVVVTSAIFSDGFNSGNTSAWSFTLP